MDERHGAPRKMSRGRRVEIMEGSQTTCLDCSNAAWIIEMRHKIEAAKPYGEKEPRKSASIFRVSESLRGQSHEHYQPKAVSIGPYHRGKSELLIKDKDKWWCVKYFLSEHSLDLEKWLCDMSSREEEARSYYSEDVSMDSHSFLEMLLLDSCFIFHAFRLIICPLLYPGWPSDQIMLDLLMLENQIPFFVLVQLYCGLGGEQEFRKFAGDYAGTIVHYAVNSFTRFNMGSTWDDCILPEQVLHLLHLFRLSLGPCGIKSTLPPQRMNDFMGPSPRYVPSVTELQDRSAIEFRTRYSHSILDIRFHNGVMKIPFLELSDGNMTILRYLIAFEQCCPQVEPGVTSYAAFMDCLIKTEDDANLLERSGILLNTSLPTSSDAAFFFSKLSPRAEVRKSTYLDHILVDVHRYHNSKWNRWIRWYADLKLNYFSSPWLSLLMVAAAVLLILSFTQICYSVISYYHW